MAVLLGWGGAGCGGKQGAPKPTTAGKAAQPLVPTPAAGPAVGSEALVPPIPAEAAPSESPRIAQPTGDAALGPRIDSFFAGVGRHRIYVQTDKPIYKPGESVWIKSWDLKVRDGGGGPSPAIVYELINPRGARLLRAQMEQREGKASGEFAIPAEADGGEYTLRATTLDGVREERPLVVSRYDAPRIKKQLEFMRKAYGPGDEVKATVTVKRPTGEALARKRLQGVVELDGKRLTNVDVTTNEHGGAIVAFSLPAAIERGDGLLSVLVDDGGITESVSKSIPIVLSRVQLSFFPEGGDLVEGVESRLYFEAKTPLGKPADVEGSIVDDQGQLAARFSTYHFGLGRTAFTPAPGRRYHAELSKPAGISGQFPVPVAREHGCVLRSFDDYDGQLPEARVAVRCSQPRTVLVSGVLRDNLLDAASVKVEPGSGAVVYLRGRAPADSWARGVLRVTVFDEQNNPLAERLLFRNRRRGLHVQIEPDEKHYAPRDQVALTVKTSDGQGNPVAAELALSVVDDTVVAFADDKTGHIESRMLLEQEISDKVQEPKVFFDLKEAKSAQALDLLMGTRGYRRFEWKPVMAWPRPEPEVLTHRVGATRKGAAAAIGGVEADGALEDALKDGVELMVNPFQGERPHARREVAVPQAAGAPQRARRARDLAAAEELAEAPPPPMAAPAAPAPAKVARDDKAKAAAELERRAPAPRPEPKRQMADRALPGAFAQNAQGLIGPRGNANRPAEPEAPPAPALDADDADEVTPAADAKQDRMVNHVFVGRPAFAAVRVFPAPTYTGAFDGVRTDFRETVHWAPSVQTDARGKAVVTFYLSDAITSFRVFAEGSGGGEVGRAEQVFKSSLPFSMNVKIPLEVSAGDTILLPLTLSNERDTALPITLEPSFGELLKPTASVSLPDGKLAGNSRQSLYYPLSVEGRTGSSRVSFRAEAGGLGDEFVRQVEVVAPGFPQELSRAGTLPPNGRSAFDFEVPAALPGSLVATLSLDPAPTTTLLRGVEGMVREPGGCFEQASSTNYPNVMVLDYLKAQSDVDPDLVQRINSTLERGYTRLAAFETREQGYEWFGQAPAHEALTAYGVVEFADMKRVWGGVDGAMLQRTVAYIKSRRDGRGGFQRNPRALDSFGGADPRITDAYILYALTEAGFTDFPAEIAAQAAVAQRTDDPYVLALATSTLLNVPAQRDAGLAAARRLSAMQKPDGHFEGKLHSITRSTGSNLTIETTALATLALLEAGTHAAPVRRAGQWLVESREGWGNWGATQATVLALKALTAIAVQQRNSAGNGEVALIVNGNTLPAQRYSRGSKDALVFADLGRYLTAGSNRVQIVNRGNGTLPFSMGVEYRTLQPATHPQVVLDLKTELAASQLNMGQVVRLNATLTNKTQEGQPMTLARIGLPGGLTSQNWQLKELVEKNVIAFYETRAREVIVYLRQMAPGETREIPLQLVANIPGEYTGPASSAYLYYSDDRKVWTEGLKVNIAAPAP